MLIIDFVELLVDLAAEKAREMNQKRRFNRRRRVGAALHPGAETPMWNELRAVVRTTLIRRGDQVKLARALGLPRQDVNSFLTRGTRMPDAERTLQLIAWLVAHRAGRPMS